MKRIIIMLICANVMHAMQYDDWDREAESAAAQVGMKKYIENASFFVMHNNTGCEVYRVPCDHYCDFECKENHDSSMQKKLDKKNTIIAVAVFYDRNGNEVGNRQDQIDYIGSLASKQLASKLDPNAKPIAVRAEIDRDCWSGRYIRFFDGQNHPLLKMPYDGYFYDSNELSADDKIKAEEYMQLCSALTIKNNLKRSKGCCVLV